jgi:LacI family transcriptional regulator
MRRRSAPKRIAILCPASASWVAPCLGGFRRYAHAAQDWHLFSSSPVFHGDDLARILDSLEGWMGDGILTVSNDRAGLRRLRAMNIPAVNLAAGLAENHGIPRVMVNNQRAGRLAADHLLGQGVRSLAFFGWEKMWYSQQRLEGFRLRATEAGVECREFLRPIRDQTRQSWDQRLAGTADWVLSLPHSTGIFAVNDGQAQMLTEACRQADVRVPDDFAVMGMDDDETICEHSIPTLTSLSRNSGKVGWEAAALLDRLMRGEPPPVLDILLEPDGVTARKSTEVLYCEDRVVLHALHYMRANIRSQYNVEEIAEHAAVSKRTLENRFRQVLRCSPHSFLRRLRVEHAQTLMRMPQPQTIEQIAGEC